MKLSLICIALLGCAGTTAAREADSGEPPLDADRPPRAHFVRTDRTFEVSPRARPSVVVLEQDELRMTPAFRAVGVLELIGQETNQLTAFYQAASAAGAAVGCDVIYQRDAFELGSRVNKAIVPGDDVSRLIGSSGRSWRRNQQVEWQFFCGVNGSNDAEQEESLKRATFVAVELRRKALTFFEPCDPYTPTGSHIRRNDVCANDPKRHTVASGGGVQSFAQ